MARYRMTIEYDGSGLAGWQRQDNGPSVQQALEEAAYALSGEKITFFAAGRTDAGVHALGQVVHMDMAKDLSAAKIADALNYHLKPAAIAIVSSMEVDEGFHARFSALSRHYLFRIVDRRAPVILRRGKVWQVKQTLDAKAMHAAAQCLVGRHDFTTFRAAKCQAASPEKTLYQIAVKRHEDEVHITCSARSFLHHQVRSFVGSLKQVGTGKWSGEDLRDALAAKDRTRCGLVAPPHGLYLIAVDYD